MQPISRDKLFTSCFRELIINLNKMQEEEEEEEIYLEPFTSELLCLIKLPGQIPKTHFFFKIIDSLQ